MLEESNQQITQLRKKASELFLIESTFYSVEFVQQKNASAKRSNYTKTRGILCNKLNICNENPGGLKKIVEFFTGGKKCFIYDDNNKTEVSVVIRTIRKCGITTHKLQERRKKRKEIKVPRN